ncbi:aspartate/glutamate racemase family protein [Paracoccus methylarcula]|uniref:Asp/Glu racemase n=1 Tax=Paracoccus methylarcula TaxID=72022 RepID=A0A3R7LNC8_9RHOB|nr:aspartate/glutamate racemase family protein [Paracoccus methylarcula]RNF33255.1 Asp/Glu racemase [Paracoccus methylarcula]
MTNNPQETAAAVAGHRLLIVNPNGNPEVTRLVERSARRVIGPGTSVRAVHPADSPLSIETPDDRDLAEPLAIALLRRNPGYDAYVMGCFDDIAVAGGRGALDAPIVCAAEAAISLARLFAPRFAIVTTVQTMVPGILSLVASQGVADRCSVRAAGIGVARAAAGGDETEARLDATIRAAREIDGAGAIILGSGGLTGRAAGLSARHGLPRHRLDRGRRRHG